MAVKHKPKPKRKPASGNPYLNQARSLSKVRFGPEQSALSQLLDDALGTLQTGIGAQEGAARGIQASVKAASPVIKKTYGDAQGSTDVANNQVASDLNKLSSAADPYKATTAREAAGAKRRIAEGLAGAIKELQDRSVSAEQGRAFAVTNLVNQYKGDVDKVQKRRSDLAGEIGAFETSTIGDLKKAQQQADHQAAQDALDARRVVNSERSTDAQITGIDPATGLPTLSARKKESAAKKVNKGAITKHQTLVGRINSAISAAAQLKKQDHSLNGSEIAQLLAAPHSKENPYGRSLDPFLARVGGSTIDHKGSIPKHLLHGLYGQGLIKGRTPKKWRVPAPKPLVHW